MLIPFAGTSTITKSHHLAEHRVAALSKILGHITYRLFFVLEIQSVVHYSALRSSLDRRLRHAERVHIFPPHQVSTAFVEFDCTSQMTPGTVISLVSHFSDNLNVYSPSETYDDSNIPVSKPTKGVIRLSHCTHNICFYVP